MRQLAATLLLLACLSGASAAGGPAPYDVQLDLSFVKASGDEGIRDEIELQLLSEIARAGCFRSVERAVPSDEAALSAETLVLTVRVTDIFEETVYDTSIAERTDPSATEQMELLHTSRIEAYMNVTLAHPASETELRSKRMRGFGTHRPLVLGEDARHTAMREATVEAARGIRAFICKGGEKRLRKELGGKSGR